ncbi:MAG: ATP-grasp domain-containing protein [Acidimicrobiia bacterium]
MRIGMLMVRHPPTRVSPIMPEVARLLGEWGAKVEVIYPEEHVTSLGSVRVEHDLYILKSGTELALSLAGVLHTAGAVTLNPYPVAVMLRDKIVTTGKLQEAGVPVPDTFVTSRPEQLVPLLETGPLVIKPYRGSQGKGVHVVWDAEEIDQLTASEGPLFVQRYHEPEGRDRKIYCIGGQLFGVKRIWPPRTYEDKLGAPFTITPELRRITMAVGKALGMELFGLDVIMSHGRPYVVDASSFPGFKGVPDAPLRLADYLYTVAQRVLAGEPPIGIS